MGTGFAKRKKQAKMMQEKIAQMQSELANVEVTGSSGGGLVAITLNGEQQMTKITIKPECIDPADAEGLEDLVRLAYQDAYNQLKAKTEQGGSMLDLPKGFPGLEF